jgi:hypothetical protein
VPKLVLAATLLALVMMVVPMSASAATIPASVQQQAIQRAEEAGVSNPKIEARETTLGIVRAAVEGNEASGTVALAGTSEAKPVEGIDEEMPVDMVIMRGKFILTNAHEPRGMPFPVGTYLTLAVEEDHVVYLSLANGKPKPQACRSRSRRPPQSLATM